MKIKSPWQYPPNMKQRNVRTRQGQLQSTGMFGLEPHFAKIELDNFEFSWPFFGSLPQFMAWCTFLKPQPRSHTRIALSKLNKFAPCHRNHRRVEKYRNRTSLQNTIAKTKKFWKMPSLSHFSSMGFVNIHIGEGKSHK